MKNSIFDYIIKVFYNCGKSVEEIYNIKNYDSFEINTVEVIAGRAAWADYVKNNAAEIRAKYDLCKKYDI